MRNFYSKITKLLSLLSLSVVGMLPSAVSAQISNPAVDGPIGQYSKDVTSGKLLTAYIVNLWSTVIKLGGLVVILYFVWASLEWVTSEGDSAKLKSARQRMTHAFIGMSVLAFSFLMISVIDAIFFAGDFSILNPAFDSPL